MRDLREELRERLRAVAMERATYTERLAWLDKVEQNVKGLLDYETLRLRAENSEQDPLFPEVDQPSESEGSVLSQFIRDILSDGNSRSLEDLKRAALTRGVQFGEKNPGRVLHFALVGMAQNGIVQMVDRGVWRISQTQ